MAFRIEPDSGQILEARQVSSPNQDERPDGVEIGLLVIHGISLPAGSFGGSFVEDLFMNRLDAAAHESFLPLRQLRVSAHVFIRRDAEVIQFVSLNRRAWHAGVSSFEGRGCCNDFSIGIELEGTDHTPYEPAQYEVLDALITAVLKAYPGIHRGRIVGHCDIAPGRKTDPGPAFDWGRIGVVRF